MSEGKVTSVKVVLVGESGVGKTSIIAKYVQNKFVERNNIPTVGASFFQRTIFLDECDKSFKFEIWDTAGQEKYRSLAKIFYRDAKIVIFTYDITRKNSFDEVKNYWYPQIKEFAQKDIGISVFNSVYAIAGNKSDAFELEEVPESEVRNFAKNINAIFKYTSAKSGKGLEDLFNTICRKVAGISIQDDEQQNINIVEEKNKPTYIRRCC